MAVVPVLLSGGTGTRLWPISRTRAPKQLQRLTGSDTMIQATARRLAGTPDLGEPVVVCNARDEAEIVRQLTEVGAPPGLVLCEVEGRNTAPAVLAAARSVAPDDVMLVLPADHVIRDEAAFRRAVAVAVESARTGALVTFGIPPHRAETGYGYIEVGEGAGEVFRVARFVEKPDSATAERYLASGGFLWNSGMFVFLASALVEEMRRHAPEVARAVEPAVEAAGRGRVRTLGGPFLAAPAISVDYAVMEPTDRAVVVPLDAGWSDVGSWASLWEIADRDPEGNAVSGDVVLEGVTGSYVRSGDRLVAVVGLDGVVVVDTGDAVLVAGLDRVQDVKQVVERLVREGRAEADQPKSP
jgi:mannose-1-phosphate guanylyltransferase / mannose-6-phosphate isomerase